MRKGWFVRALRGGVLAGLTIWAACAAAMAAEEPFAAMRARPAVPPAAAPDVVLQGLNGSPLRLAQLRGKAVILGFFVTT